MTTRRKSARGKPARRFPPEVLAPNEVRALLDACDTRSIPGLRNRALLAFIYRTGLRIREALEIRPKDLDLERGASGGGGGPRSLRQGRAVADRGDRPRRRGRGRGVARRPRAPGVPVFCTVHGTRLTEAYVRRLLPLLARRAGIVKRVHAHGLRHTHAAELRAEGFDIGIIFKQLGHATIATTARYLDHIAPWAVVEAVGGRVW